MARARRRGARRRPRPAVRAEERPSLAAAQRARGTRQRRTARRRGARRAVRDGRRRRPPRGRDPRRRTYRRAPRVSDADRLAVVAHELRSPIAAIASLAEAATDVPDDETRRRLFRLAIAAARDVERILSDPELLSLRVELVDVGALASSLSSEAVAVRVAGRPMANADPTRLRQAIGNLVANGLRHGTRVAIDVTDGDGVVAVDVTDDGPGIDPDVDPFARGVSGAGSSGLGLWLARDLAEAHGGSLEVVAHAESGARLRLVLASASASGGARAPPGAPAPVTRSHDASPQARGRPSRRGRRAPRTRATPRS